MASVKEISVAVESVIHNVLRDVAEHIWKEHQIRLDSVDFEWLNASDCIGTDFHLTEIRARTASREKTETDNLK